MNINAKNKVIGFIIWRPAITAILVVFLFPTISHAIGNFHPSEKDLKLLPSYCKPRAYNWGNDKKDPRTQKWYRIFGGNYIHMHHYCQAILYLTKADLEYNSTQRSHLLKNALDELKYMEKRATPDFVLLPELHVYLSKTYRGLNDPGKAFYHANKAVNLKPDYIKGVKVYADLAVSSGQRDEALKAIETALKKKPKSSSLKRRLECLKNPKTEINCPEGYLTREK